MSFSTTIVFIITWLIFCFLAAWIAKDKKRDSVGFFILALFLSPLIAIIALAIMGDSKEKRIENIGSFLTSG